MNHLNLNYHQNSSLSAMPQINFLSLPRELRQRVLLLNYDFDKPIRFSQGSQKEERIEEIKAWILTLKPVHSEIFGDMKYVKGIWHSTYYYNWSSVKRYVLVGPRL